MLNKISRQISRLFFNYPVCGFALRIADEKLLIGRFGENNSAFDWFCTTLSLRKALFGNSQLGGKLSVGLPPSTGVDSLQLGENLDLERLYPVSGLVHPVEGG